MINKISYSPIKNTSFKARLNIKGDYYIPQEYENKLQTKASKIGSKKDFIDVDVFQPETYKNEPLSSMSQDGGVEIGLKHIPTVLFWDAIIDGQKYGGVVRNDENDILASDYDAVNDTLDILKDQLLQSKK